MPVGTRGDAVQGAAPCHDSIEGPGTMPATLHNLPPEEGIFTATIQMRKQWLGETKLKVTQLVSGKTGAQASLAGLWHVCQSLLEGVCLPF